MLQSHFPWLAATPVYFRDFAYPNSRRRLMDFDNGKPSIIATSAAVFADLLSGPTVDIYIGAEKRHWALHAKLLAFHSEYLQKELARQWDESLGSGDNPDVNPRLRLDYPEHDPKGFELLVKWLYQWRLDDATDTATPEEKYEHAVACQRLHDLCEQFGLTIPMDRAMDQYRKGLREAGLVPDAGEMLDIYSRTHRGSPFRTLITRIAARQIMDPDSDKDAVDYRECFASSPDFAIQVINAIKSETGGLALEDPTEEANCAYHVHAADYECGSVTHGLWIVFQKASNKKQGSLGQRA
jgi:hypothetical protein